MLVTAFVSCEDDSENDSNSYPGGLAWPFELVTDTDHVPTLNFKSWKGDFRIGDSTSFPMLVFSRIVDNSGDKSTMIIAAIGAQAQYELFQVNGKEIKVICTIRTQGSAPPENGALYTLCTDYTLSGSGPGATLTFTGGNVPIVSDQIWTLRK